jgi:hypothetical protein
MLQEEMKRIISLLQNFDIDKEKLYLKVIPFVQEVIVELLRPNDEELLNWKTSSTGRLNFIEYLSSRSIVLPNDKQINALWNYYMGYTIRKRNQSLVKLFKQINRDKSFCVYCNSAEKLQVDHKIPLIKGGNDDLDNMQYLCTSCNLGKLGRYDYSELIC